MYIGIWIYLISDVIEPWGRGYRFIFKFQFTIKFVSPNDCSFNRQSFFFLDRNRKEEYYFYIHYFAKREFNEINI